MVLKYSLINALIATSGSFAVAQSEHASIKNTIMQLFEGMRSADSTTVKATMAPEARLLTVVTRDSQTQVKETPISEFIRAVGSPRTEVWDEQVQSYDILVDQDLATAWTPYKFYRGNTFSHCGVNAFQLYRTDHGWKIIQITDTRRKENCLE